MKKLCAMLCLFVISSFAQDAERTISHVDHHTFELGTIVTFTLSDYSTWKKFIHLDHEHLLHTICDQLHVGDKVAITEKQFSKHFCLEKPNTRKISVGMAKGTKSLLPTIKSIQKVTAQEAGWFSKAKYAYDVTLSDSSMWRQPSELVSLHWREGDAVIVNAEGGKAYLVNVDAEHYLLSEKGDRQDLRGIYFDRTPSIWRMI